MIALLDRALAGQRAVLRLAMACAALAAIAAVGLLAVSGGFLAGAGVAGAAGLIAVQGFNYLLPSAFVRAAAIVRTAARYGERMLGHRAALFALAEVRTGVFAGVAAGVLAGRPVGRSGDLASRLASDVDALEDAVVRRPAILGAALAGAAGLAASLALGWRAALLFALGLAAMGLSARVMAARWLPAAQARLGEALAALRADYADIAEPVADIAVYGLAGPLAAALDPAREQCHAAKAALARAEAGILASQTGLAALTLAAMAMVARGSAPSLAFGLLGALAGLEMWAALAQHAIRAVPLAVAEQRLASLVTPPVGHAAPAGLPAVPPITIAGQVCAPGSRLRIAGPSGCGKTRLVETLAGLRVDAPESLAVAGHDPRRLGLAALRDLFAIAQQDAPLIAGSVADNLRLARAGLTERELWAALAIAGADDVVRALPDGLDSWLGGDGARLSGGQRRRLALARALLSGKPWLILDEPTEGLDAGTEAELVERLAEWFAATGTGLLLITHRPAAARLASGTIDLT